MAASLNTTSGSVVFPTKKIANGASGTNGVFGSFPRTMRNWPHAVDMKRNRSARLARPRGGRPTSAFAPRFGRARNVARWRNSLAASSPPASTPCAPLQNLPSAFCLRGNRGRCPEGPGPESAADQSKPASLTPNQTESDLIKPNQSEIKRDNLEVQFRASDRAAETGPSRRGDEAAPPEAASGPRTKWSSGVRRQSEAATALSTARDGSTDFVSGPRRGFAPCGIRLGFFPRRRIVWDGLVFASPVGSMLNERQRVLCRLAAADRRHQKEAGGRRLLRGLAYARLVVPTAFWRIPMQPPPPAPNGRSAGFSRLSTSNVHRGPKGLRCARSRLKPALRGQRRDAPAAFVADVRAIKSVGQTNGRILPPRPFGNSPAPAVPEGPNDNSRYVLSCPPPAMP
jgi:hypothetical protein